jgi:hypothetical protein
MHHCTALFCTARHRIVHILCRSYRTDRNFPPFKFLFDGIGHPCPFFECMDTHVSSPLPTTPLSANGHFDVLSSIEHCSQQQAFLPMSSIERCSQWQPKMPMDISSQSANGHFGVLSSFECCSQWQSYLPLDISVSFPLLNVAPNNNPICLWTFRCLFLFCLLLPVAVLSDLGHLGVLSSFERCSQQQPYLPLDIHVLPSL